MNWKDIPPPNPPSGPLHWALGLVRFLALALVIYGGLATLLLLRLFEAPLFAPRRPWTPHITQKVCRAVLPIMGLPLQVTGQPMQHPGALVANHQSWLDIFCLNAAARVYFVAKAEVSGWLGIGWLARATGTVFIARKGTEAKRQQEIFEQRLRMGHRLLFFPEGTSTDAARVLPFKSTLFQAFYTHGLDELMHIQPVTVVYHPANGGDPRQYGWWGDMTFASHFWQVLTTWRQGRVEVIFHDEIAVNACADRKALAAACEAVIRAAHPYGVQPLAQGRDQRL